MFDLAEATCRISDLSTHGHFAVVAAFLSLLFIRFRLWFKPRCSLAFVSNFNVRLTTAPHLCHLFPISSPWVRSDSPHGELVCQKDKLPSRLSSNAMMISSSKRRVYAVEYRSWALPGKGIQCQVKESWWWPAHNYRAFLIQHESHEITPWWPRNQETYYKPSDLFLDHIKSLSYP